MTMAMTSPKKTEGAATPDRATDDSKRQNIFFPKTKSNMAPGWAADIGSCW